MNRRSFVGGLLSVVAWAALGCARWIPGSRYGFEPPGSTDYVSKTRRGLYRFFYIQVYKPFRRVREETWRLKVGGLCGNPREFTLSELKSLPRTKQTSRLKCVECWSAVAEWEGFHISELERIVRPSPSAVGVVFRCADTYVEFLKCDDLRRDRVLLVHGMDGKPLPDEHGFPLRVIIPFKYGYKNPKCILEMEYVDHEDRGTWSRIGPYSVDGTILPGYDHPLDHGKKRRRINGGEVPV